jgi:hypothetical protein
MTMDTTYWSALSQISATLVGFVLVAVAFYIEQIREVVLELNARWSYCEEASSSLMLFLILSNLITLVAPLASCLFLLAGADILILMPINGVTLFGLTIGLWQVARNPVNATVFRLKQTRWATAPYWVRVLLFTLWLVVLALGMMGVSVSPICGLMDSATAGPLLALILILQTLTGLLLSVYDLQLFTKKNVVVWVKPKARDRYARNASALRDLWLKTWQNSQSLEKRLSDDHWATRVGEYLLGLDKGNLRDKLIAQGVGTPKEFRRKLTEGRLRMAKIQSKLQRLERRVPSAEGTLPKWARALDNSLVTYGELVALQGFYDEVALTIEDIAREVDRGRDRFQRWIDVLPPEL